MPENEVLSTADVATLLGCNETLIRTKKSRNSDRFNEGQHFVKGENNRTLWTMAGVEVLRELVNGDTSSVLEGDTDRASNDTMTDIILNTLLERTAQTLAIEFYKRLPVKVMEKVEVINKRPTRQQVEEVKQHLLASTTATALLTSGMPEL